MAALRSSCGHYIFCPVSFFFSSANFSGRRLDVYHTSTHDVVLVRIYNAGLKCAWRARWKCRTQKPPKIGHLGTIAQVCRAISSQLRYISTIGKKFLNSNIYPTCPHNMVNFSPITADILSAHTDCCFFAPCRNILTYLLSSVREFGAPLQISTGFASWQRYCMAL